MDSDPSHTNKDFESQDVNNRISKKSRDDERHRRRRKHKKNKLITDIVDENGDGVTGDDNGKENSDHQKVTNTADNNPAIDVAADAALINPNDFLPLTLNNFHLDVDAFICRHPIIVEILRRHPLRFALTQTVTVPLLYLQQVWHTLAVVQVNRNTRLEGRIDVHPFIMTCESLREALDLPTATAIQGRVDYDPFVTESQLCEEIKALGYSRQLPRVSAFKRQYLTPLWYTLFTILNRCLSSKTRRIDQCSANFLHLFHGVAYHRHIDYADILWTELVQNVQDKGNRNRRNFVPFMRFLQIAIRRTMSANRDIPRRSGHPVCPEFRMHHMAKIYEMVGVVTRRIPEGLLAYANPAALSVLAYRHQLGISAPMTEPALAGPPWGAHRKGRRSRATRVQDTGVHGWGVTLVEHEVHEHTSFGEPSSLGPQTLIGTHPASHTVLCEPAGTSVVGPQSNPLQGLDGNPISAIIPPTLNMGHTVDSTRHLSEPGVTQLDSMAQSFAKQLSINGRIEKNKHLLNDNSVAEHPSLPTPPPPPPPPSSALHLMSIDELKSELYTRLLSQAEDGGPVESQLIGVLHQQLESPHITRAEFNDFRAEVRSNFTPVRAHLQDFESRIIKRIQALEDTLIKRIQALEDTLKSQADSTKRHHDEHANDHHRHEGEKRQRLDANTSMSGSTSSATSIF